MTKPQMCSLWRELDKLQCIQRGGKEDGIVLGTNSEKKHVYSISIQTFHWNPQAKEIEGDLKHKRIRDRHE